MKILLFYLSIQSITSDMDELDTKQKEALLKLQQDKKDLVQNFQGFSYISNETREKEIEKLEQKQVYHTGEDVGEFIWELKPQQPLIMNKAYRQVQKTLQCQNENLIILGLDSQNDVISPIIDVKQFAQYCPANRMSCCGENQFEILRETLLEAEAKLKTQFEIIQEVLLFFKGPNVSSFLRNLSKNSIDTKKCINVIDDVNLGKNDNFYEFAYKTSKKYNHDIQIMLKELGRYQQTIKYFYGNIVCSLCTPESNQDLQINSEQQTVTFHQNVCFDIIHQQIVEFKLANLYQNYIRYIIYLIICTMPEKERSKLMELEFDLDLAKMNNNMKFLQDCYLKLDIGSEACMRMCSKRSIHKFSFLINFVKIFSNALQVLFTQFIQQDVSSYYKQVKNTDFRSELNQSEIIFIEDKVPDDVFNIYSTAIKYEVFGIDLTYQKTGEKLYLTSQQSVYLTSLLLIFFFSSNQIIQKFINFIIVFQNFRFHYIHLIYLL